MNHALALAVGALIGSILDNGHVACLKDDCVQLATESSVTCCCAGCNPVLLAFEQYAEYMHH